jgi:TldD protein
MHPLSAAAMNARLLAMAKDQGRDVYAVETLGGALAPRLLYLVHPDGSRQLVRGAVFDELDNRSLRSDIIAAGDDEYVANSLGTIPATTIAPSLLFRRHRRQARHHGAAEAALLRPAAAEPSIRLQ